jgi:carboxylesterase type B
MDIKPSVLVKKGAKIEETIEKKGSSKIGFLPLRDGKYIDNEGTLKSIQSGKGSKIPLLVGSNAEEMQLFFGLFGILTPLNDKTVIAAIRQRLNLLETNETKETNDYIKEISNKLMSLIEKKLEKKLNAPPEKKQILEGALTFLQFNIPAYELAEAHKIAG